MEQFKSKIKAHTKRARDLQESIQTEEATKTAIIMPFFNLLGYDVFNPLEFCPEFTADVGIKKGEKVDYAILQDGDPLILIECKSINEPLTKHDSQLFRYFGTTSAKFSILTNGIEYRFFTDLEEPNRMDLTPFFSFNILNLRDSHIQELSKFQKINFDAENIASTASELKYLNALNKYIKEQIREPEEEFVKFLIQQVYDGIRTKSTIDKFTPIIQKSIQQIINEKVNDKLNAALKTTGSEDTKIMLDDKETAHTEDGPVIENDSVSIEDDGIVTTPEELECYSIVKVILKDTIEPTRVFYRDNRSYFNILLDDNIRKWIIRVYFESTRNYIMLNNANNDKERTVLDFIDPIDLLKYQEEIIQVAELANEK